MDVDSTFITAEVVELLADRAGSGALVAQVTERAMRGELDFAQSLHERVATLEGLPESVFEDVLAEVELSPGAERLVTTVQEHGWHVGLVSGGFVEIVAPLAARLGITLVRANRLGVADGRLTGRVVGDVVDRAAKAATLREYARATGTAFEHTVAIGDGANDLDMMAVAAYSVAYRAKPLVRAAADATIEHRLDEVLDLPFVRAALGA
jgi:phosphoserine phosphatase